MTDIPEYLNPRQDENGQLEDCFGNPVGSTKSWGGSESILKTMVFPFTKASWSKWSLL